MVFNVEYQTGLSLGSRQTSITADGMRVRDEFLQFRKNRKTVFMVHKARVIIVKKEG